MGKILALVGPSGTGKTTIAKAILGQVLGARMITSITTRTKRKTDLPEEYQYVSPEEMGNFDSGDTILWSKWHGGNRYCTTKISVAEVLDDSLATGIMILVPDVLPILRDFIREYSHDDAQFFPVFIIPPNARVLRMRLLGRGDAEEDIHLRILEERMWEKDARSSGLPYRFVHNNGSLKHTVERVLRVLSPSE